MKSDLVNPGHKPIAKNTRNAKKMQLSEDSPKGNWVVKHVRLYTTTFEPVVKDNKWNGTALFNYMMIRYFDG